MSVIKGIEIPNFDELQPGHVKIHVPVFKDTIQIHTGKMGEPQYLRIAVTGNQRVISRVEGDLNVAVKTPLRNIRDLFRYRGPSYNILDESVAGIVLVGQGNGLYDLDDERVKVSEKNVDVFSHFVQRVAIDALLRQRSPKFGSTNHLGDPTLLRKK